jgi:hypothetical protein
MVEARDFFLLQDAQIVSGIHVHSFLFNGYWGKQLIHEVHHSPTSRVKDKNKWSYTSTSPTCLHGVDRGSFTVFIFLFWCCNTDNLNNQVHGLRTRIFDAPHRLEAQHCASPTGSVRHAKEHSGVCGTTSSPG